MGLPCGDIAPRLKMESGLDIGQQEKCTSARYGRLWDQAINAKNAKARKGCFSVDFIERTDTI